MQPRVSTDPSGDTLPPRWEEMPLTEWVKPYFNGAAAERIAKALTDHADGKSVPADHGTCACESRPHTC